MEDFNFLGFLMHPKEESLGGGIASDYLLGSNASTENVDLVESSVTRPSIPNSLCGQDVRQPCLARVQTMTSDGYPRSGMEIMRVRSQQHKYSNKAVHQQLYEVMPSLLMNQKTTHRVGARGAHSVSRAEVGHWNIQRTAIMSAQQNPDWERESSDLHKLLTLLPRVDPDQPPSTLPGNRTDGEKQAQDRLPAPHLGDNKLDIAERLPYAGNLHVHSSARDQYGLSDFLQDSSQQYPQTNLSLDDARLSASGPTDLPLIRYSKYLKPVRELLVEFCNPRRDALLPLRNSQNITSSPEAWNVQGAASWGPILQERDHKLSSSFKADHQRGNPHPQSNQADSPSPTTDPSAPQQLSVHEWSRLRTRKEGLIEMMEELDMRYEQYRAHMEQITASFESVTGPGAMAAAYTALVRRSISRQFRGLRDAIEDQIHKVCEALGEELSSVPILNKGETPRLRILDQRLRHHRALHQQLQVWRPQRGLPERSVSVLRAWLFEHFLHPYPNDSEKLMLARLAGLTRIQVSNWFVNARVRLWKPMIEEMYAKESKTLESNEAAANVGSIDAVSYENAPVIRGQGDEAMSFRQTYALGSTHVEHMGGAYREIIPTTMTQSPQQHSNMAPMPANKIALLTRYL